MMLIGCVLSETLKRLCADSEMELKVTKTKGNLRGNAALGLAGPGRPKGIPNKVTIEFRETVRKLLEDNADNFGKWIGQVAEDDPGKAVDLMAKLAEFAAPKLARTEIHGPNDGPVALQVTWKSDK